MRTLKQWLKTQSDEYGKFEDTEGQEYNSHRSNIRSK